MHFPIEQFMKEIDATSQSFVRLVHVFMSFRNPVAEKWFDKQENYTL